MVPGRCQPSGLSMGAPLEVVYTGFSLYLKVDAGVSLAPIMAAGYLETSTER